jgi:hypothetical protein
MAVSTSSGFHTHSSWGRTRQPKSLTGANGTQTAAPPTAAPSAATDGYITENQRYLHVLLKDAAAGNGVGIVIWAYSHAFGAWGKLVQANGNSAQTASSSSSLNVAQVFEISGADRVYFQRAQVGAADQAWDNANDELYAACSTF